MQQILEQQKFEKQFFVNETRVSSLVDRYGSKFYAMRSSNRINRVFTRYVLWANSFIIKDNDIDIEDDDVIVLVLEDIEFSFFREAQFFVNNLE